MKSKLISYFLHIMSFVLYLEGHCHTQGHLGLLICYLLGMLQFYIFTFRSVIHFELILVRYVRSVSSRSVAKSCPAVCEPMNCSMPGFSVLH